MAQRKHELGPPTDLANMRAQGIRPVLHEIRNHLNAAFSSATTAHERAATPGEKAELAKILTAIRRALLKLHRTSEQIRKGERESVDPID
jgi:hypothetical protein